VSVPEDALRAARASQAGSVSMLDQIAASLEFTASQLQPALGELEKALDGRAVDAAGFGMGMMAATFATTGLDIIECVKVAPVQFAEFLALCERMQGRAVCGHRGKVYPSITCGLDPDHDGQHSAGRLRW
jgi:hypothetical protein